MILLLRILFVDVTTCEEQLVSQSVSQSVNQAVSQFPARPVSRSISQSVTQYVSQVPARQTISQSISQSDSQSVSPPTVASPQSDSFGNLRIVCWIATVWGSADVCIWNRCFQTGMSCLPLCVCIPWPGAFPEAKFVASHKIAL